MQENYSIDYRARKPCIVAKLHEFNIENFAAPTMEEGMMILREIAIISLYVWRCIFVDFLVSYQPNSPFTSLGIISRSNDSLRFISNLIA